MKIEKVNSKQSNFANALNNYEKSANILDKKYFLINLELLFSA